MKSECYVMRSDRFFSKTESLSAYIKYPTVNPFWIQSSLHIRHSIFLVSDIWDHSLQIIITLPRKFQCSDGWKLIQFTSHVTLHRYLINWAAEMDNINSFNYPRVMKIKKNGEIWSERNNIENSEEKTYLQCVYLYPGEKFHRLTLKIH